MGRSIRRPTESSIFFSGRDQNRICITEAVCTNSMGTGFVTLEQPRYPLSFASGVPLDQSRVVRMASINPARAWIYFSTRRYHPDRLVKVSSLALHGLALRGLDMHLGEERTFYVTYLRATRLSRHSMTRCKSLAQGE